MCRSWFYKTANSPLRKADHLSQAIGDIVFVSAGPKQRIKIFVRTRLVVAETVTNVITLNNSKYNIALQ